MHALHALTGMSQRLCNLHYTGYTAHAELSCKPMHRQGSTAEACTGANLYGADSTRHTLSHTMAVDACPLEGAGAKLAVVGALGAACSSEREGGDQRQGAAIMARPKLGWWPRLVSMHSLVEGVPALHVHCLAPCSKRHVAQNVHRLAKHAII